MKKVAEKFAKRQMFILSLSVEFKNVVSSARPFPYGVGSLRNYVRTIVQTTNLSCKNIKLCKQI